VILVIPGSLPLAFTIGQELSDFFSTAQPMGFYERTLILTTGKAWISTHAIRPPRAILLATFPNLLSAVAGAPEAQGPDSFNGGENRIFL
jgi:hypothetical protein